MLESIGVRLFELDVGLREGIEAYRRCRRRRELQDGAIRQHTTVFGPERRGAVRTCKFPNDCFANGLVRAGDYAHKAEELAIGTVRGEVAGGVHVCHGARAPARAECRERG